MNVSSATQERYCIYTIIYVLQLKHCKHSEFTALVDTAALCTVLYTGHVVNLKFDLTVQIEKLCQKFDFQCLADRKCSLLLHIYETQQTSN